MSMIEDEALAIYSAAKEQQAAVAQAIEAMNKASKDITGRYTEFLAALNRVENVPHTALEPLKAAVVASVGAGLEKHLTSKTKALGVALAGAAERVDEMKDRGMLPLLLSGLIGSLVGGAALFCAQMVFTPAPALPTAASVPADSMPAEPAPKKRRH